MSADKTDTARTHETDFAALWSSDGVTRSVAATGAGVPADLPFLFASGQRFGPYLIVRPLGKGGMGQVYEAEEIDSGRRVAIKLLSRGLGDDEERERFLREGQLAASLSHPNVVYVFGTSEVQGFPVIAMELAPAGTLKDLVDPAAPMTVAAAVDAILQVIAGLEAAAAIGILHRDVKPSNCFLDRDGRVMVGDFGLSIAATGAPSEGAVLGTPGFASPEQMRGAPLDVRSDLYSVGATIYYLLTGRTPFDTSDLQTMITRLATETAPVVTAARPDIPGRFGSVVAKCLGTKPADRYATYAALAAALEPFRTTSTVPAPLGRRFAAGFIDSYAASLPLMPLNIVLGQRLLTAERDGEFLLLLLPSVVSAVAYYTLLEGRFGCAAGKAALNLRVVDEARHAPGFRRALLRSLAFIVPSQLLLQGASYAVLRMIGGPASQVDPSKASLTGLAVLVMTFVSLALLFIPARRRNGYAAFHDRVSRTRVVVRPGAIQARAATRAPEPELDVRAFGPHRIGPYLVTDAVIAMAPQVTAATVVDGYDDKLRRAVWLELLPRGTPPVPAWRRDLNRPGRVRWISGRRSESECWDAYERIGGAALAGVIARPQPWSRVRHWVADIARELAVASRDGSMPGLHHDRIWIARDDRARLLDWTPQPAPGETPPPETNRQKFLYGLAVGALVGEPPHAAATHPPDAPLPGSVRALLLALRDGTAGPEESVVARCDALLREAAAFSRRRRLLQLVVCAAIPVTMSVAVFSVLRMQLRARTADPPAFALKACLNRLESIDRMGAAATEKDREERELIEIYIAERLREPAEETASYARAFPAIANLQKDYRLAERALRSHPQRTAEQVARAETVVAPVIVRNTESLEKLNQPWALAGVLGLVGGGAMAFVAMLAVVGAVVTRSGFTLRGFGAMLVTARGVPVTRGRAVARAFVTWSPIVLWIVIVGRASSNPQQTTPSIALSYALFVAIVVAGALYAWRHPARGIQDWIAGTWIVPR